MRFMTGLVLALALGGVGRVEAQTLSPPATTFSAVTPETILGRMEAGAQQTLNNVPSGKSVSVARIAQVDICWAQDGKEHLALGRNGVLLVTAVSHQEAELPLKRVFVRTADGAEIKLERLSGGRSPMLRGSVATTLFGEHREDSFYILPAKLALADGMIVVDFAINRDDFNTFKLPADPPDFIKAMSGATSRPKPDALVGIIRREYRGFSVPTGWK